MFTIYAGQSLDNVILGQLPKRIIVNFVDNKTFKGDEKLNLFNFKNYIINFFSLYDMQIPSRPLQQNFSRDERGRSTSMPITPSSQESAFTF